MGYEARCSGEFKILPDQVPASHAALLKYMKEHKEDWYVGFKKKNVVLKNSTLSELLHMFGYEVEEDVFHGIADMYYEYDKVYGDEIGIMFSIAPFVVNGSYLDWVGEDNTMWRWLFENGTVREQSAVITYVD